MGDSDDNATSTRQKNHIISMLVSMFHQTYNFRYSKYIKIITYVGLKSFLLAINLDTMSFSNVFSSLIFRYVNILPF